MTHTGGDARHDAVLIVVSSLGESSRRTFFESVSKHYPIWLFVGGALSIDYMLRESVGYARQDLAALEPLAAARQLPAPADVLVADALAMARRHLQTLEQLPVDPAASTIVRDGKPAYDND